MEVFLSISSEIEINALWEVRARNVLTVVRFLLSKRKDKRDNVDNDDNDDDDDNDGKQ